MWFCWHSWLGNVAGILIACKVNTFPYNIRSEGISTSSATYKSSHSLKQCVIPFCEGFSFFLFLCICFFSFNALSFFLCCILVPFRGSYFLFWLCVFFVILFCGFISGFFPSRLLFFAWLFTFCGIKARGKFHFVF